jgi:hypothetical protein
MLMRIDLASLIEQGRQGERPTARAFQVAVQTQQGATQTAWVEEIESLADLIAFVDRHGRLALVDHGWTDAEGRRILNLVIWEEGEPSPFNY